MSSSVPVALSVSVILAVAGASCVPSLNPSSIDAIALGPNALISRMLASLNLANLSRTGCQSDRHVPSEFFAMFLIILSIQLRPCGHRTQSERDLQARQELRPPRFASTQS